MQVDFCGEKDDLQFGNFRFIGKGLRQDTQYIWSDVVLAANASELADQPDNACTSLGVHCGVEILGEPYDSLDMRLWSLLDQVTDYCHRFSDQVAILAGHLLEEKLHASCGCLGVVLRASTDGLHGRLDEFTVRGSGKVS